MDKLMTAYTDKIDQCLKEQDEHVEKRLQEQTIEMKLYTDKLKSILKEEMIRRKRDKTDIFLTVK
jgi:hypothetical protein